VNRKNEKKGPLDRRRHVVPPCRMARTLDLIVFGATGFTGRLVAE